MGRKGCKDEDIEAVTVNNLSKVKAGESAVSVSLCHQSPLPGCSSAPTAVEGMGLKLYKGKVIVGWRWAGFKEDVGPEGSESTESFNSKNRMFVLKIAVMVKTLNYQEPSHLQPWSRPFIM